MTIDLCLMLLVSDYRLVLILDIVTLYLCLMLDIVTLDLFFDAAG